jgi:NAD(P)-dependent dehydrogenase (short-subunit alcohol dehydrogenase family)
MMKDFLSATPETVIDAAAQPINRRSTPQEQANALVFLNSDLASYINGVPFPVDGGFVGGVLTGQVDLSAMMAAASGGK